MTEKTASTSHYILLDLVRILAIFAVVGVHIAQALESPFGRRFGLEKFYFVSLGGIGVSAFIILSGLVLELTYGDIRVKYSWFVKKRILRLYPMYYMAFVIGTVGFLIRYLAGVIEAPLQFGISDVVLSLTAGYAFVGEWGGPVLRSGWFIGVIVSLYLLYPFLSKVMQDFPLSTLLGLLVVSCLSRYVLGHYALLPGRPLDWFPLCRVFEFGLGVFFARTVPRKYFAFLNDSFRGVHPSILFLSALSYPLYLVHVPIFDVMIYSSWVGISSAVWVPCFIIVSLYCSAVLLKLDRLLMAKFAGRVLVAK